MSTAPSGYVNWDVDGDRHLDEYEFLMGYRKSHYILSWCNSGHSLTEAKFYNCIFNKADKNEDGYLAKDELNKKMPHYLLGGTIEPFQYWDSNGDHKVNREEFTDRAAKSDLLLAWDKSRDKKISETEIARMMFDISDFNGDGSVSDLEFNIWNVNR